MNLKSSTHLLMLLNPASNGGDYTAKKQTSTYDANQRMLYYSRTMKRLIRPATIISISLLIALFSMAVTYTAKISGSSNYTRAAFLLQTTPTPPVEEDRSEVGSTDGIVIMGGVIGLIVIVPILVKRKSWMRGE